jgi:hypothetical protein
LKPILLNTGIVRAILDGSKTQTRRLVKPQPRTYSNQMWDYIKPPYKKGETLWVRETWGIDESLPYDNYVYRTNYGTTEDDSFPPSMFKWRPSIHMPREAARIFLKVKSIRPERLQDITPHDAWEEGCRIGNSFPWEEHIPELQQQCRDIVFKGLWNSIYNNWDENPWVWRIEFEMMEG